MSRGERVVLRANLLFLRFFNLHSGLTCSGHVYISDEWNRAMLELEMSRRLRKRKYSVNSLSIEVMMYWHETRKIVSVHARG